MGDQRATNGIVLYVEDEESDTLFMQMAFKKAGLGLTLRVVSDGQAALDYLSGAGTYAEREQYPVPKVVLLDLNLPVASGFEVLKWMRGQADYKTTPVVVFTSSSRAEDKQQARELGANEYVEKPTSALLFGDVVQRLRERWLAH
jgi:CheY-like chemotaxis protein